MTVNMKPSRTKTGTASHRSGSRSRRDQIGRHIVRNRPAGTRCREKTTPKPAIALRPGPRHRRWRRVANPTSPPPPDHGGFYFPPMPMSPPRRGPKGGGAMVATLKAGAREDHEPSGGGRCPILVPKTTQTAGARVRRPAFTKPIVATVTALDRAHECGDEDGRRQGHAGENWWQRPVCAAAGRPPAAFSPSVIIETPIRKSPIPPRMKNEGKTCLDVHRARAPAAGRVARLHGHRIFFFWQLPIDIAASSSATQNAPSPACREGGAGCNPLEEREAGSLAGHDHGIR